MRCFIALPLPEAAREELARGASSLRRSIEPSSQPQFQTYRLSWAKPEGYHVTLAFLGEIEGRAAEVAASSLHAVAGTGRIPFSFSGLGALPSTGRRRVLIAGIDEGGRARELWRRLDEALAEGASKAGIAPLVSGSPKARAFRAHATLARLSSGALRLPAGTFGDIRLEGAWTFERCTLFMSELRSAGAVYTELERVAL
jgi:2'-5' RNA ligase